MKYVACILYAVTDLGFIGYLWFFPIPISLLLGGWTIRLIDLKLPLAAKIALILLCFVTFCVFPVLPFVWSRWSDHIREAGAGDIMWFVEDLYFGKQSLLALRAGGFVGATLLIMIIPWGPRRADRGY